jgi:hypothetical protein
MLRCDTLVGLTMIDEEAFNDLVRSQMVMCCVFSNHGMLLCTQTPKQTHSTCAASLPAVLVIVQWLSVSYMTKAVMNPDIYITSALQGRLTSL